MDVGLKNFNKAFTLAEVLITLGMIGIIAAMTIPVLLNSLAERDLKTKWKKEFSTLSQAFTTIKTDHSGNISEYLDGVTIGGSRPLVAEFVGKLRVVDKCLPPTTCSKVLGDDSIALDNFYKSLDNVGVPNENLLYGQIVLNDGAYLYFRTYNPDYTLLWVDVNGPFKKPNVLGKDLFIISITKDKIEPMGTGNSGCLNTCNSTNASCSAGKGFHGGTYCAGAGCSAQYLYSE